MEFVLFENSCAWMSGVKLKRETSNIFNRISGVILRSPFCLFSLFLTELNGTWRRTRGYCIHVLHTPFNDIAVYFWLKLEKWKRTISCMPRKKIFQFSGRKKQIRYNLVLKFVWCTHFLILFAKSR